MIRRHERPGRALRSARAPSRGPLTGIRVIELADEQAEYCGLTLAGLGADVDQGGAARRQPHAPHRALLRGPRGSRALAVLLAVQPRQALDRARPARSRATAIGSARSSPPPTCCWSRRRGASSTGCGLGASALMQQYPTLIVARDVAVRRRRPVGRLQGLGPGAPGARRRDDELRLRSRARRHVRPAADRAADVARLSTSPASSSPCRDHRRAALSLADGQGPARVVRRSTRRWRSPPRSTS